MKYQADLERITSALHAIPPYDRDVWWQCAVAVKSALGEQGFPLWDEWSQQDTRRDHGYNAKAARAVWQSARPHTITIATVFYYAQQHGWTGDATTPMVRDPVEEQKQIDHQRREEEARQKRAEVVAEQVMAWLQGSEQGTHPYLENKGFTEEIGLIRGNELLIPVRNYSTDKLQTVQRIWADGTKKFVQHGIASGGVHRIGPRRARGYWYCEGYATALSIKEALAHLYREDQIVVCFSAANVAQVAGRDYKPRHCKFVVADHDFYRCSVTGCYAEWEWRADWGPPFCPDCGGEKITAAAGEKYAVSTQLPWWMPPDVGDDGNDHALKYGVKSLADGLRSIAIHSGVEDDTT